MPTTVEPRHRRRSRRGPHPFTAAAVLAVLLAGAGGAALYATPSDPPGSRPAVEPYTEQGAVAAALDAMGDYAEGEYGEAWDRWPSEDQALFGRADYIRLYALCPPLVAGPFLVASDVSVELRPPERAEVTMATDGVAVRRAMSLQGGWWRLHLGDDQRAGLGGRTVEQVAGGMRADGMCGRKAAPLSKRMRKTARPTPSTAGRSGR